MSNRRSRRILIMRSKHSPRSAPSKMRFVEWAILGAGLAAGASGVAAASNEVQIKMQKEAFVPAASKVAAGARIVWTNTDTVPHSVTANDQRFDSGAIAPGQTFTWS